MQSCSLRPWNKYGTVTKSTPNADGFRFPGTWVEGFSTRTNQELHGLTSFILLPPKQSLFRRHGTSVASSRPRHKARLDMGSTHQQCKVFHPLGHQVVSLVLTREVCIKGEKIVGLIVCIDVCVVVFHWTRQVLGRERKLSIIWSMSLMRRERKCRSTCGMLETCTSSGCEEKVFRYLKISHCTQA